MPKMILIDVKATAERRKARETAFMEMLTDEQRKSFISLRQLRECRAENYVNDYDKNASEVLDFMYYLNESQFAKLPDIEAGTVFSIITRVLLEDHDNMLRMQDVINKRPSRIKSHQAKKGWIDFKAKFEEYIKEGKEVGHARALVGDSIEAENRKRLTNSEKLIGVKGFDKNGEPNIRPSRKTLERQLKPHVLPKV